MSSSTPGKLSLKRLIPYSLGIFVAEGFANGLLGHGEHSSYPTTHTMGNLALFSTLAANIMKTPGEDVSRTRAVAFSLGTVVGCGAALAGMIQASKWGTDIASINSSDYLRMTAMMVESAAASFILSRTIVPETGQAVPPEQQPPQPPNPEV